jgi:hypothetical protein
MENMYSKKLMPGSRTIAFLMAAFMIIGVAAESVWAKTAKEINNNVNACLGRFYQQVPG